MTGGDWIPAPRVGWGGGMAGKQLITGLCPGGKVRMERLARGTLDRRMNPALMAWRPAPSAVSKRSMRRSRC